MVGPRVQRSREPLGIVFVVPYVPSVIANRPLQLLRGLVSNGHRVTLATVWTRQDELAPLRSLRESGIRVVAHRLSHGRRLGNCLRAAVFGEPLQARYALHPALLSDLDKLSSEAGCDVIHVTHLRGAAYGLAIRQQLRARGVDIPVVWDAIDCLSHLLQQAATSSALWRWRALGWLEAQRTAAFEGRLVRAFERVLVSSEIDRAKLAELGSTTSGRTSLRAGATTDSLRLVPNGVDPLVFRPRASTDGATIVFTGAMSYHPNVTAALRLVKRIMPAVWSARADARLRITGARPIRSIRSLAANPRVTVTGTVASMREHLAVATVAVVPLTYGAGSQFKVLEAMACGVPVVCSSFVARALGLVDGRQALVADEAEAFARAIVRLLNDPQLCRKLGEAGRELARASFDWTQVVGALERIYAELRPGLK